MNLLAGPRTNSGALLDSDLMFATSLTDKSGTSRVAINKMLIMEV